MLETLGPADECPHVFVPGTAARTRASLAEWPTRPADARCAWCGQLVDVRPWARDPAGTTRGSVVESIDAPYAAGPGS